MLVFLPHAVWMARHGFRTMTYVAEQGWGETIPHGRLVNPGNFVLFQISNVLPMAVVLVSAAGPAAVPADAAAREQFSRALLATMVLVPGMLYVAISAPLNVQLQGNERRPALDVRRTVGPVCLRRPGAYGLAAGVVAVGDHHGDVRRGLVIAARGGRPVRPASEQTHFLSQPGVDGSGQPGVGHVRYHRPLPIIAGDYYLAGTVAMFSPQRCRVYQSWHRDMAVKDGQDCPWMSEQEFYRQGGVIVWKFPDPAYGIPAEVVKRLGVVETIHLPPLDYRNWSGIPPLRVSVAFIPPADRRRVGVSSIRSPESNAFLWPPAKREVQYGCSFNRRCRCVRPCCDGP